jgi:hypothetical protein
MASSIFFNGRKISIPGAYTKIDASALDQVELGANGIVAVLGTAEGGKPVDAFTSVNDVPRLTTPQQGLDLYRDGDLREAIQMLFNPSTDPDIPGGAVQVIPMKVNPATQASGSLSNAYGAALDLTSKDYGAFADQINVLVAAGTNKGKAITVTFEDETEAVDDLAGDAIFTLKYTNPGTGWDTMTANVVSGGSVECDATRAENGLDSQITAQMAGNDTLIVASDSVADTTQSVTVYGLDDSGDPATEIFNLNGTTNQVGTQTFSKIHGVLISAAHAGTVTVKDSTDVTTHVSATTGTNSRGLFVNVAMYVSGSVVTAVAGGASTDELLLIGKNATGGSIVEKITLNGTTPVVSVGSFSLIEYIAAGDVAAATAVTYSAQAAKANVLVQSTVQKAADYFNSRFVTGSGGFVFTIETTQPTLGLDKLDVTDGAAGAVSILDPAEPEFYADLYTIQQWFEDSSQYIDAEISSGAIGGAPSNLTAPVFLSGGTEGTTTTDDWQAALNWLKEVEANSVVVLTGTPAIHAQLEAHCAYMGGQGRNERDGFVGLLNAGLTDVPTKTEAKAQIVDINSRHIRAFAQAIERYNIAGVRTEFAPYFLGCIAAGMQAGSTVGTPLTRKYANVLAFRQDSSWSPVTDSEELINAGLCFLEQKDGVGRRFVRNITTHLSSNNLAYIEASANEAINFTAKSVRNGLEDFVGNKAFAGNIAAIRDKAANILQLLLDEGVVVDFSDPIASLSGDTVSVSFGVAPVLPINFIPVTINLTTATLAA